MIVGRVIHLVNQYGHVSDDESYLLLERSILDFDSIFQQVLLTFILSSLTSIQKPSCNKMEIKNKFNQVILNRFLLFN